ncbi:MAG: hypothetical protein II852_01285 [Bacteroidales bacterium]|nr:hypothetical protein [Bacteroidales bacterium]
MIYLIDDTLKETIDSDFVFDDKYNQALVVIQNKVEFNSRMKELYSADCIMVHLTFEDSNDVKDKASIIADDGDEIPFVVFSGSFSENPDFDYESNNYISGIKKSTFYQRLHDFLEEYVINGNVDLRIIAYGKDFQKVIVRNYAKNVLSIVEGKQGLLQMGDIANFSKDGNLKRLVELSNPKLGIDYEHLLETLGNQPICIADFKSRIEKIVINFEQYGKNIYTWK